MRFAWLPEDGSDEYFRSTLSLSAAALAPFWMMSQKVSPGAPWVIIAIVMRAVFALPAPTPAAPSSAFFPPLPLQPAIASARPATKATASRFRDLNMLSPLPVGLRPRLDGGREVHM